MHMITAEVGEKFYCITCQCNQIAVLRCKLNASITDSSATVRVTLFDTVAQELLQRITEDLGSMSKHETHELLENRNKRLQNLPFHVKLRAQRRHFDENVTRYTVQQMNFNSAEEATDSKQREDGEGGGENAQGKRNPETASSGGTEANTAKTADAPISPLKKMTFFESLSKDMPMTKRQQMIKKNPGGSTFMVMFSGTLSTNPCLLLLLEGVLSYSLWKFRGYLPLLPPCPVCAICIFVLALVGVFYPYNRGALLAAMVVIYAFTSGIAGYTSASFYCQLKGTNWVGTRFAFLL